MATVLVTGAAGFVAKHFIAELTNRNPDLTIIGLDRDAAISYRCDQRVICDLAEPHAFQSIQALTSIDYVVHFAAQSDVHFSLVRPDIYVRDNVLATSNLVQALTRHTASIKRFLQVSSCEVYGNSIAPSVESDRLAPRTPYAASKACQELMALSAIDHQALPVVVCRLFNNYGYGQQGNRLIPRIMQAIAGGRPFGLVGDGSQTRDWIAVEDTSDALVRVMLGDDVEVGGIFNIASQQVFSVLQVLEFCEAAAGGYLQINRVLKDSGHLQESWGNSEKLRSITGWQRQGDLESYLTSTVKEVVANRV